MAKRLGFLLLLVILALPVVLLAQEATPEPVVDPIELPAVDPLAVTGDIITAGSSTVFPLSEAVAQQFIDDGYADSITIDSIGSGAGFERFCAKGETDIANASRAIRDSEIESCGALTPARTPIEFRVGTDALAVVMSTENDFVDSLTCQQLASAFSGAAATWADLDPSWPAETIRLFSPGTDSGTFDYFVEAVLTAEDCGNLGDGAEAAILGAANIQFSEDDNVLVQGVEGSPYAIGYFGFAYYVENQEALKALAIDGGEGPVTPDFDTVEGGTYLLARPLFIYSDATIMAEKPQVADFINYYLTNVNDVIQEVGYFPASVEALNASKQAWLDAVAMGM
ncbi:MAG TPA: PstS family phosphate ABC transporter substrate-binding protein [Candidatus Limnocylindrales bacterium]|nr:PstS family phosphate ABC transporter substrate-binding protein [Candidatus Limnocylindrales bacterium]